MIKSEKKQKKVRTLTGEVQGVYVLHSCGRRLSSLIFMRFLWELAEFYRQLFFNGVPAAVVTAMHTVQKGAELSRRFSEVPCYFIVTARLRATSDHLRGVVTPKFEAMKNLL